MDLLLCDVPNVLCEGDSNHVEALQDLPFAAVMLSKDLVKPERVGMHT